MKKTAKTLFLITTTIVAVFALSNPAMADAASVADRLKALQAAKAAAAAPVAPPVAAQPTSPDPIGNVLAKPTAQVPQVSLPLSASPQAPAPTVQGGTAQTQVAPPPAATATVQPTATVSPNAAPPASASLVPSKIITMAEVAALPSGSVATKSLLGFAAQGASGSATNALGATWMAVANCGEIAKAKGKERTLVSMTAGAQLAAMTTPAMIKLHYKTDAVWDSSRGVLTHSKIWGVEALNLGSQCLNANPEIEAIKTLVLAISANDSAIGYSQEFAVKDPAMATALTKNAMLTGNGVLEVDYVFEPRKAEITGQLAEITVAPVGIVFYGIGGKILAGVGAIKP
jgi:hypothetical protein